MDVLGKSIIYLYLLSIVTSCVNTFSDPMVGVCDTFCWQEEAEAEECVEALTCDDDPDISDEEFIQCRRPCWRLSSACNRRCRRWYPEALRTCTASQTSALSEPASPPGSPSPLGPSDSLAGPPSPPGGPPSPPSPPSPPGPPGPCPLQSLSQGIFGPAHTPCRGGGGGELQNCVFDVMLVKKARWISKSQSASDKRSLNESGDNLGNESDDKLEHESDDKPGLKLLAPSP